MLIFCAIVAEAQMQAPDSSSSPPDLLTKNAVLPEFSIKRKGGNRLLFKAEFQLSPDSIIFGPDKVPPNGCIVFGLPMIFSFTNEGNGIDLRKEEPKSKGKNRLRLRRVWETKSKRKIVEKKINGKKVKDTIYVAQRTKNIYRSVEYSDRVVFSQMFKVRPIKIKKEGQPTTIFKVDHLAGQIQYQINARNPKILNGGLEETQLRTARFDVPIPRHREKTKRKNQTASL